MLAVGGSELDVTTLEAAVDRAALRYDRDGDQHYDVISAFIKSIRGSDVDASLHYLARMVEAGEDPRFIARRLVILASEDIGLADPTSLLAAVAAADAVALIGMPEGRINLAQAVIHLALAPKSNAVVVAVDAALADVRAGLAGPVPPHLRDAHYGGAAKVGSGEGYVYPHDQPGGSRRAAVPARRGAAAHLLPPDPPRRRDPPRRPLGHPALPHPRLLTRAAAALGHPLVWTPTHQSVGVSGELASNRRLDLGGRVTSAASAWGSWSVLPRPQPAIRRHAPQRAAGRPRCGAGTDAAARPRSSDPNRTTTSPPALEAFLPGVVVGVLPLVAVAGPSYSPASPVSRSSRSGMPSDESVRPRGPAG